ncbi:IcmE/DotG protein [Legionella lansingensis]|uniref:IcmE/DotG protein n=1 Tax=Legionella lansingensis TaxID=45067 RepID=A0A0W0VF67_9GAMM|nr:pentapeptide repeat-containing protein [Legionella lansingensis]KTD18760.1 IcmE/DotG protein [Legionella lansingensis]SNV58602.1 IcmE/DotG protein [Legionella lansingensis]
MSFSKRIERLSTHLLKLHLLFLLFLALEFCWASTLICKSPYRGQTITDTQLKAIINMHQEWLQSDKKDTTKRANLCDTTLAGLDLSKVNLSFSNLSGADLSRALLNGIDLSNSQLVKTFLHGTNLTKADLHSSDMAHAILEHANLSSANLAHVNLQQANLTQANLNKANLLLVNLRGANLSGADLSGADLQWAILDNADLSGANLTNANLENASLQGANLKHSHVENTNFANANLRNAIYQPQLKGLPNLDTFHMVKNFKDIQFADLAGGKATLTKLKLAYMGLGLRSMERTIAATMMYHEMVDSWRRGGLGYLEAAFNYILLYITCDFGAAPGRPLKILFISIFLYAILYRIALSFPSRFSGIVTIWSTKRFVNWDKTKAFHTRPPQLTRLIRISTHRKKEFLYQLQLIRLALFFSFMSSFSIGWRGVNISNWISHLQAREYTLEGLGWVRVVAGIQAVMSAYLIILWLFAYFGLSY